MLPLVYSVHAYLIYTIAFAVALAIWSTPERIAAFWLRASRDPGARTQDRGSFQVVNVSVTVGVVVGFSLAAVWTGAAIPWFRPQVTIAGILIILLGVALRWWAVVTLGRYFTLEVAVRSTQTVVQSGPYRYVRHPAYSAILLSLAGTGLALANWASLVALLAGGLIGLLYRVRVEERVLTEALGKPYVDYMHRTRRFIPFLF